MKRALRRIAAFTTGFILSIAGMGLAWVHGWNLPGASGASAITVTKLHAEAASRDDQAIFVMFVGSDLRPGVGGARGDALHLIGINPKLHKATVIDIPRDTCATFGGHSRKINEANSNGGVANQAAVVGQMVGVPISYGVEVDFAGFSALVKGVGGLYIDVPMQMHDSYSGAYFPKGALHLSAEQSLAFARNRHDFARSDIQRTWNQGYLMIAAIKQLQQQYTTISGRFKLVDLLVHHAQLNGLNVGDLVDLGQLANAVPSTAIANVTIPSSGGACLSLAPAAQRLFADFRDNGVLDSYPAGTVTNPDPRP